MELRNYRKFRQVSIEFPDGVVGVLGPNGSGKSTLLEAVAWALYGNEKAIMRDGKKEGIRSSLAGMNDDCSVLLDFEIAGDHYRLFRSMRGKSQSMEAQLSVNGKQLAKTDKGVTEEVRKVLGMDYKSFFISVFARQKELNALTNLNASERGKVVRRMLGIESLTRTVEEIDRDKKGIQDRLFGAQQDLLLPDGRRRSDSARQELSEMGRSQIEGATSLEGLQGRLAGLEGEVATARSRRDALGLKEEEHGKLLRDQLSIRKEAEAAKANADRARTHVRDLERKGEEMPALAKDHDEFEQLTRRKEDLDGRAQAFERRRLLLGRRSELAQQVAKAKAELGERTRAASACSDYKGRLQTVEESRDKALKEREELRSRAHLAEAEASRLSKEAERTSKRLEEIERLGPESTCPTCERKLCEQHSLLVHKLEGELSELGRGVEARSKELNGLVTELDTRALRLDSLEKRRRELQSRCEEEAGAQAALRSAKEKMESLEAEALRVEEALAGIEAPDFSEEEHASLKRRLQAQRPRWDRCRALKVELEALPRWRSEIEANQERLESLEARGREVEARLQDLGYREGERKQAQAALDSLLASRDQLAKQVAEADKRMERLRSDESAKRQVLEDLERRERAVDDLTRQLEEQTALSKAMRDFRESMMARVVPTLSDISSRMFEQLTDGRYAGMALDADYDISVYDKGEQFPLARFSGGEADLANLCLRLAISRVIAERAGSALNFLILDEIFGSQDQARKRNIMEAFAQLSRQFSQILLITHIEDVKDLVANVIMVGENEDGSSSASLGN